MPRIRKILVANRGEIARRVLRTCRAMGIRSVAIFSDADAGAPFVREADGAFRVGPPPSSESYLHIERILDAARKSGADAIHPGYGFLSENATFARACAEADRVFIGPSADVMEKMGSKRAAKRIAVEAGVPVVPGYDGADQSLAAMQEHAAEVGFPILLKASAGGGGKGMRIVRSIGELASSIESARREAEGAFGDGTLLLEKYIEQPRHVEIQILGDQHGTLVHLHERECSIQRRYQKIIEETPSLALDDSLRARMGEAAVQLGRAIGYTHAGTVEFILTPSGEFYFLEVNARLQVEHPVTECVAGIDLVREQIRIAQGERLGYEQDDIEVFGASIEVRLYAEDPAHGFFPATGTLSDYHIPELVDVRDDTGVEAGAEIGIHYDPMLAKLITHAPTREEALDKLRYALEELSVHGVATNRDLLLAILDHPEFRAGEIDTHFLERHPELSISRSCDSESIALASLAAAMARHEERRQHRRVLRHVMTGYRNNPFQDQFIEFEHAGEAIRVTYQQTTPSRFRYSVGEQTGELFVVSRTGWELTLEIDGCRMSFRVTNQEDRHFVTGSGFSAVLQERPRFPRLNEQVVAGGCLAPMPGKVIRVNVEEGQRVAQGDVLVIMEAMKMEHSVSAPHDGHVEAIRVSVGEQVDVHQVLVQLTDQPEQ